MTDEKTLNGMVSEEDARRRERTAFVEGAAYGANDGLAWHAESRRRYPIRKKVRRVVTVGSLRYSTDSNGTGERFVVVADKKGERFDEAWLYARDLDVVRDLLDRPYDEVEE